MLRGARVVCVGCVCRIVFGGVCFCAVSVGELVAWCFARWGFVALRLGAMLIPGTYCCFLFGVFCIFVSGMSCLCCLEGKEGRRIGLQECVFLRAVEEGKGLSAFRWNGLSTGLGRCFLLRGFGMVFFVAWVWGGCVQLRGFGAAVLCAWVLRGGASHRLGLPMFELLGVLGKNPCLGQLFDPPVSGHSGVLKKKKKKKKNRIKKTHTHTYTHTFPRTFFGYPRFRAFRVSARSRYICGLRQPSMWWLESLL